MKEKIEEIIKDKFVLETNLSYEEAIDYSEILSKAITEYIEGCLHKKKDPYPDLDYISDCADVAYIQGQFEGWNACIDQMRKNLNK